MSLVNPSPVPLFEGTLPDPADRGTYGARGRQVWLYETGQLVPALNVLAGQTFENAEFANQMAAQAASLVGFLGNWDEQTGAATMPASVLHDGGFWVLMANVADITAHEPGVSVVWAEFSEAATAAATLFDNAGTGLAATQVQAAIVEMLAMLAVKVGRTSASGSVRFGSRTTLQREVTPQVGDRAWNPDLNGGRGAWETWDGTAWEQDGWVVGPSVATTSGAQIDFNGIPAWVNEVKIVLRNVSTTSDSNIRFQLGTSVGFETSGYESSGDGSSAVTGMMIYVSSAGQVVSGEATFIRGPGDTWDYTFLGGTGTSGLSRLATGRKTMSGAVSRIRFLAGTSATFDAGAAYMCWRK